jgi:hypothetical protein
MTRSDLWHGSQGNLFKLIDGEFQYLSMISVDNLTWGNRIADCPYCGSALVNGKCPGCQNSSNGFLLSESANVTFHGPMPIAAQYILDMLPGQLFFIQYVFEGSRVPFRPEIGGIKLTVIALIKRSIPMLTISNWDDENRIYLNTTAECRVEIIAPEEK